MRLCVRIGVMIAITAVVAFASGRTSLAADADSKTGPHKIELADGKLQLEAPTKWEPKKPKVNFIDYEFAIPAAKDDPADGRLTVMGAGGDIDANITRWVNQFDQPDGGETKNLVPEPERKKTIAGVEVRFVDLMGTYRESTAPFDPNAKIVEHEKYRMLAAIIVTPKLGNYFFKFYGPRQTVSDHADEFRKMIDSLQVK